MPAESDSGQARGTLAVDLTSEHTFPILEHMFASRLAVIGVALFLLIAGLALGAARPTSGAAPETRYVVQAEDTLWDIASSRYEGDPREGVWRIMERNGLADSLLHPGEVIVLP